MIPRPPSVRVAADDRPVYDRACELAVAYGIPFNRLTATDWAVLTRQAARDLGADKWACAWYTGRA